MASPVCPKAATWPQRGAQKWTTMAIVAGKFLGSDAPPRRSGGLGLKNVQQRLEARYEERRTFA